MSFAQAWWLEGARAVPYAPSHRDRLYKWVVVDREGELALAAMPREAGREYHAQLVAALALALGWCGPEGAAAFLRRYDDDFREAGVIVLGGGVLLPDGTVRNASYRFGPVPEPFATEALAALGIGT